VFGRDLPTTDYTVANPPPPPQGDQWTWKEKILGANFLALKCGSLGGCGGGGGVEIRDSSFYFR
jgi:hypothetical protein